MGLMFRCSPKKSLAVPPCFVPAHPEQKVAAKGSVEAIAPAPAPGPAGMARGNFRVPGVVSIILTLLMVGRGCGSSGQSPSELESGSDGGNRYEPRGGAARDASDASIFNGSADEDGSNIEDSTSGGSDADVAPDARQTADFSDLEPLPHNINPGAWAAKDGQGRSIAEHATVGDIKPGKTVVLFYYLWHGQHGTSLDSKRQILDIEKRLAASSSLAVNPTVSSAWDALGCPPTDFYYWAEPLFGYYKLPDEWLIRKHMQMFEDAGIDVLVLDTSNGFIYEDSFKAFGTVLTTMRKEGYRVPSIAFLANPTAVQSLYDKVYRPSVHADLWYKWNGKPLMLNTKAVTVPKEVQDFFTWRESWAWLEGKDRWPWLQHYPQKPSYHTSANEVEEVSVSFAQHATSNIGRSYHDGVEPPYGKGTPEKALYFTEQLKGALSLNAKVLLITQWNEWIAQRLINQPGERVGMLGMAGSDGSSFFVDEFSEEFSRDGEPRKGGFEDLYYWRMVDGIRQFQGATKPAPASSPITIDLDDFSMWNEVAPTFRDRARDTVVRDAWSVGNVTHYVNNTGRNDIVLAKLARDKQNAYFFAWTQAPLTEPSEPTWMNLFVGLDSLAGASYSGFHFVALYDVASKGFVLQRYTGDGRSWSWKKVGPIKHVRRGKQLVVSISRAQLGMRAGTTDLALRFKWSDHMKDRIPVDWLVNGDAAPNGRFAYRYISP